MRRMKSVYQVFLATLFIQTVNCNAQTVNQFEPDFSPPEVKPGMKLVWSEEFNYNGKPDTPIWIDENGFVRIYQKE
jgi:hypothetical protein